MVRPVDRVLKAESACPEGPLIRVPMVRPVDRVLKDIRVPTRYLPIVRSHGQTRG